MSFQVSKGRLCQQILAKVLSLFFQEGSFLPLPVSEQKAAPSGKETGLMLQDFNGNSVASLAFFGDADRRACSRGWVNTAFVLLLSYF